MANRFYEALMCGVVTLFAPNTSDTVSKSGYDLDTSCILPKDLYGKDLMDYIQTLDYQKLLTNQQKISNIIIKEREQVLISIKDFICSPNTSTKQ